MQILPLQKEDTYKTIRLTDKFEPVLFFKIGQMKLAIQELTNWYNTFYTVLATGIQFTEAEYMKFEKQFEDRGRAKALEVIERVLEGNMYEDKFFTFLRK